MASEDDDKQLEQQEKDIEKQLDAVRSIRKRKREELEKRKAIEEEREAKAKTKEHDEAYVKLMTKLHDRDAKWQIHGNLFEKDPKKTCSNCDRKIQFTYYAFTYGTIDDDDDDTSEKGEDEHVYCRKCYHRTIGLQQFMANSRTLRRIWQNKWKRMAAEKLVEWTWVAHDRDEPITKETLRQCCMHGNCWYQGNMDRMNEWSGYQTATLNGEEITDEVRLCSVCSNCTDDDDVLDKIRKGIMNSDGDDAENLSDLDEQIYKKRRVD